jgi:muconate cycloisomerase
MIEEPFGRGKSENLQFVRDWGSQGFMLAADESAITPADVHALAAEGSFRMINIRLAKNGGILRALAMRAAAHEEGLSLQAGCHVGETGILSAAGRASASLMPDALYVDGSYDGYIFAGNITRENYTFGHGGKAPVITGRRLGYDVDKEKLETYTTGRESCF